MILQFSKRSYNQEKSRKRSYNQELKNSEATLSMGSKMKFRTEIGISYYDLIALNPNIAILNSHVFPQNNLHAVKHS